MKKALRSIAVFAGIISAVATVVLGYIYLEDIVRYVKNARKSRSDNTIDNI